MTNQQESRLSMYLTFRDFQVAYTAITNPLPNYSTNSTAFVNAIPQIQSFSEQQKISKKGVTANKNQLKESLIVTSADYARKLAVYAKFSNNSTLANEVKFSESKLRQVADTAVKDYAQIVYDRAQTNLTALSAYGITAATQASLLNAINAYNSSIGRPGISRTEMSQITKQLDILFKTAETALDNMDAAVEIVRLTQPDFYSRYKNARKVIVTGTGGLAVKGAIMDSNTGSPIMGATIAITFDGKENLNKASNLSDPIIKKSAAKGGFVIKSLPAGTYQVKISKHGYADLFKTMIVNQNELTNLNVSLSKV